MSVFTTNAFDKAEAAWKEALTTGLWVPAAGDMAEGPTDAQAYQPLTYAVPDLRDAMLTVTGSLETDMAVLQQALKDIFTNMMGMLQPTEALQSALVAADALIAAPDIGRTERLRDEFLSQNLDPLAGMKQLGVEAVAPIPDNGLRSTALASFAANRERARSERSIALKTRKIELGVQIINLTRDLVMAEVEAQLKLLTTASLPLQEEKMKTEFATAEIDNRLAQMRYQTYKLDVANDQKQVELQKATGRYERIALKSGLSTQAVQSVIRSGAQAAAGAINSVRMGYQDSSTDRVSIDLNA